ncbi:MAG: hypothetical protein NT099_06835 [Candidatus Saganbacteria bacterium]|nr:hypothetical protein [Candidatus Saganbacteria bacterium]
MKRLLCLCLMLGILTAKLATSAYAEIKATAKNEGNNYVFHLYDTTHYDIGGIPIYSGADDIGAVEIKVNESGIDVRDALSPKISDGEIKAYDISGHERNFEPGRKYDPVYGSQRDPIVGGFDDILKDHPDPVAELTFRDGKLNGPSKIYDYEISFVDNMASGSFAAYQNGKLCKAVGVVNGLFNGPYNECNLYGAKHIEANYINGKLSGQYREYNSDGTKCIKEANYMDGELNGLYREYNSDGAKCIEEANYVTGKLSGSYKLFNDDGMKINEAYYVDGKIDGNETVCFYNPDKTISNKNISNYQKGSLLSEARYDAGALVEKIIYDEEGQAKTTYEYNKKGKIIKTINNKQEGAQEEAELAIKWNEVKSKLSKITEYYKYSDIVTMLGSPSYSQGNIGPNGENLVEVYGSGMITWGISGHDIKIMFTDRYVYSIMLDNQVFRVFNENRPR